MKRCYNAGKVGTLSKEEYTKNFDIADEAIIKLGMKPISPLRNHVPDWAHYWLHMAVDIALLISCSHVRFQHNSIHSRGAKIEYRVAKLFKKTIILDKGKMNIYKYKKLMDNK